MAENVMNSDLNLPEPTRPRIQTVPDVQGKSHCSRALSSRVAALAAVLAVMILVVVIALYVTLRAGSQQDSTALSSPRQNVSAPLSPTSQEDSTKSPPSHGEAPGKSCCSTTRVAVLVTEIILLLLTAVFQMLPCKRPCSRAHIAVLVVVLVLAVLALTLSWTVPDVPTAGSQNGSKTRPSSSQNVSTPWYPTSQQDTTPMTPTSQEGSTKSHPSHGEAPGCPPAWKKHGRKCYFFSPEKRKMDWTSSRAECAAMGSDLVIIESREELSYLLTQSRYEYYLLGLRYSPKELKWKWINKVEHDPAIFSIHGPVISGYHCTVIGYGNVSTSPCHGTETTKNMCEKTVTI
ncbi:C-type lectin domain family 7 member A-like [Catharus ustulatus]|uniref:C-type lectin domain family 7 member A-like n=1 Tax=Catharus ustulatus TaxID=91951 RepID=UPI00140CF3B0|nr:C-type lectin domain family 7 member A-like [Catharus ustulatus]